MITIEQKKNIVTSENFESTTFGIDEENLAGIFQILRSSLYADPIYAVLREYGTNAVDAHIEAGYPDRKFKVTLPTRFDPTLKIRDYGIGLTDDKIKSIYSMYGKSTKTETNDQTGQLGLGSKSGFSYGDSFQIRSFVDGIVTNYDAYIDESLIGKIARVSSLEAPDELNGIEIVIAVKPSDVNAFNSRAAKTYSYFKIAPEIVNLENSLERAKPIISGSGWRLIGSSNPSVAIMGNIAYPIHADSIPNLSQLHTQLLEAGIELDVSIGDVQMSASREALQYTGYTRKHLKERFDDIIAELEIVVAKNIETATNIWDAKVKYRNILSKLSSLGRHLDPKLKGKLFWNGLQIDSDKFTYQDAAFNGVNITTYRKDYVGQRNFKVSQNQYNILADDKNVVIINDIKNGLGVSPRLKALHEKSGFTVAYIIRFDTPEAKTAFYKATQFHTVPVLSLESLPKPESISNGTTKGVVISNKKHTLKCFLFNRKPKNYSNTFSIDWDDVTVDLENGSGVWVSLDRFQVKQATSHNCLTPSEFERTIETLKAAGVPVPTQVFGFKPSALEDKTLGDGWVSFWDFAKTELDKLLNSKNIRQDATDLNMYRNHDTNKYSDLVNHLNKLVVVGSPMADYITALNLMKKDETTIKRVDNIIAAHTSLRLSLTDIAPTFDLTELRSKVNKAYPLVTRMSSYDIRGAVEPVIEYINLKDAA